MEEVKKNIYTNGTVLEDMETVLSEQNRGIWNQNLANEVIQVGEFENTPFVNNEPSSIIVL